MTQTITRIYESRQHAEAAATELQEAGFSADQVLMVPHPGGDRDEASAAMTDTLVAAKVYKPLAVACAAEVVQGGALVTVFAPFGTAAEAERIMLEHNPVGPAGFDTVSTGLWQWDESAVFSSGFYGMPVKYDEATPFSKFWNLPVLIDPAKVTTAKWWPLLAKNAMTLGRYEQIWHNPAPLSTKLGWPVKTVSQFFMDALPLLTNIKQFMSPPKLANSSWKLTSGYPMLIESQFVLKAWPMLTAKLAPLSDWLQLPLLTAQEFMITAWPLLLSTRESFPSIIEGSKKLTAGLYPLLAEKETVLGMWPMLTAKIAPLSDALNLPLLTAKEVVLTFWPVLAKEGYSLSAALGIPLLFKGRAVKS